MTKELTPEEKLLQILDLPDMETFYDNAVDEATGELDQELTEEQRATLAGLIKSNMPSPEELIESAKLAEHNSQVEAKRQANLERRKLRRNKKIVGSKKRNRRANRA